MSDVTVTIGVSGDAAIVNLPPYLPQTPGARKRGIEGKLREILSGADSDGDGHLLAYRVPQDFPTPWEAMDFLRGKQIGAGTLVRISVADGVYTLPPGIVLDLSHPQGDQIQLIGNQIDPAKCVLMASFPPTNNAVACSNGHRFGLLDGFRVDLPQKASKPNNVSGIIAVNGSYINLGSKIQVNNFYYGINASYGSTIHADFAQVSNAGDVGIWAFCGSQISARHARSSNCVDRDNQWGYGFQAEYASQIDCEGAYASGNLNGGFAALSGSVTRALNTISENNLGSGYFSLFRGVVEAWGGQARNNGRFGWECADGSGMIYGVDSQQDTLGTCNHYATLDTAGDQGRLLATRGPLRVDTATHESIYFNTGGGLQAEIRNQDQAENHVLLQGSQTGKPALVSVDGKDQNIDLALRPKGSGSVQLGASYHEGAPMEARFIEVKGSDDAKHQVWVASGFMEIKDADGVMRKVLLA
ncbi:hypothetical protein LQR31_11200 [Chromobacterium vaccinii]|uniref:hypothetical protein n=1 Tax=Chromobacterium vaccinii TaxID=1108595 RepID=UPI001E3CF364|nr:hypothetical protein [Chromobacterium vaccinii]MCD4485042.1 hypothetical protein [Chromobacterium vaccinii]